MAVGGGDSYLMPFGPHAKEHQEKIKSKEQEQKKKESKTPKEAKKT